jgi:RNA polymerase sigma factor (sigma-70 family)
LQRLGDQELISGCLRNDVACWQIFVERFARLVHWSIRKTLTGAVPGGKEEFSREVFQELFERLLEKNELQRLRTVHSVRKFLSVMACHMTLDKLKGLSRYAKKNFSLESAVLNNENTTLAFLPVDPMLQTEFDGIFGDALSALSPKERACLQFHYEEGKTHLEISRLLGLPENTVSTVLRRTREKLQKKLSENGYEV